MGSRVLFLSLMMLCMCPVFLKIGPAAAQNPNNICNVQGCNCGVKVAPWKNVTCTLNSAQDISIQPYQIPEQVVEVFINGGQRILLSQNSFSHLPGLSLLHIDGTRKIVMDQKAFYNLTRPSLLIQIQNCDRVDIKTGAFESVQSSIEIEIIKCASVSIEKTAFNRLSRAEFRDVQDFVLAEGTFEFRNQANIGKHGPVTTISFDNVKVRKIPHQTFFSSLAEIKFRNSEIAQIENEAFFAHEISAISIVNSKIDRIQEGAFIEKTLIYSFIISNCTISTIETRAVMAAITNLTVQHSRITEIQSGAINSTVANLEIVGNEIKHFRSSALVLHKWTAIIIEQNLIKDLHANFLMFPPTTDMEQFLFKGNDVFHLNSGALSFVSAIDMKILTFQGNFFNRTCHCFIDEWIIELITVNETNKVRQIRDNSFCTVTDFLSKCLELPAGVINIRNFTELVCNSSFLNCTAYNGETKVVNTSSKMLYETENENGFNWITFMTACIVLLVCVAIITFSILVFRGSRWLKRTGYFRKIQYTQNETSNDEENTVETVDDENDKMDISEELSLDLLQDLSKMLDDPGTHQQATDMIEQLYQKYIREGGQENNNQQEEDAHLYEELGNLNEQDAARLQQQNDSRSILKIMEEKFNLNFDDEERQPALVGDYSEPSDATVHLYSELKQNKGETEDNGNKDSLKSRGSGTMALRPLPDKPGTSKMQN